MNVEILTYSEEYWTTSRKKKKARTGWAQLLISADCALGQV